VGRGSCGRGAGRRGCPSVGGTRPSSSDGLAAEQQPWGFFWVQSPFGALEVTSRATQVVVTESTFPHGTIASSGRRGGPSLERRPVARAASGGGAAVSRSPATSMSHDSCIVEGEKAARPPAGSRHRRPDDDNADAAPPPLLLDVEPRRALDVTDVAIAPRDASLTARPAPRRGGPLRGDEAAAKVPLALAWGRAAANGAANVIARRADDTMMAPLSA